MTLRRLATSAWLVACVAICELNLAARTKAADAQAADAPRQAARVLKPGDRGVGRRVADVSWKDLNGRSGRLGELAKKNQTLVIAVTSTSCPLSKKYSPTLARLEKDFASRGVSFLLVNPLPTDSLDDMRSTVERLGLSAPYVHDKSGAIIRAIGATSTTDVLVIDAARTVLYHGAVDDQYGLGYALDQPRRTYLADALNALLTGRTPLIAATDAPGCALDTDDDTKPAASNITYHNRVSRIVQNHCAECHRSGGTAPFALTAHADLISHKAMIRQVVERSVMPPWFAASTPPGQPTPWSNDRSLARQDKDDLLAWLAGSSPVGDAADAPLPREFHDQWQIGEPDVVLQLPRAVAVKADGTMAYQHLVVETSFEEDKWVQAAEVQPTAKDVVHHVLVFVQARDDREFWTRGVGGEEGRGFLAAYVPGNSYFIHPDGFAKRLPKHARLHFQLHYTPNGTATTDQTRLALRFSSTPPKHEVKIIGIANTRFRIPPGESNFSDSASIRVPGEATVTAFFPHMHLRGKAFRYEVTFPDGRTETVLDVPRYDFNWQLEYRRAEPINLPAGATIKVTGWFDNSKENPANPNPNKTVGWGPQTYDEMLLGYVEYYLPNVAPGANAGGAGGVRAQLVEKLRDRGVQLLFQQADANGDGRMDLNEVRKAFGQSPRYRDNPKLLERNFQRLDADRDGSLTAEEFARVREIEGQ